MNVWFGADIGGTSVKAALLDDTGTVLARTRFATEPERGPEDLCRRLVMAMDACVTQAGTSPSAVRGAGFGVPAFLDLTSGTVVEAINLGWHHVPLQHLLNQVFPCPVALDNDANLAALGEAWAGAGRGVQSLLGVTLGTGVGGGIVLNGRVYHGANGMAGEIGHFTVQPDGWPCNCGRRGCLETVASATGLLRAGQAAWQAGQVAGGPVQSAEDVCLRAAAGDAGALAVVRAAASALGYVLAQAAALLNPEVIVLGGGVAAAGEVLLAPVQAAFAAAALSRTRAAASIRLTQLGADAGVVGACRLAALAVQDRQSTG
ncbi:MAG: ROK family glucokinase [Alicyclobacillus sp.]|nr:ROK family glucokinase [Alicyclobacillus sp.]